MNQLALAYGIAGLSAAIAIAVVVGTYGGPDADPTPAVYADRGDALVAARRRERPRRAQAAAAAVEPPPAEVQAPAGVQYVDEQGNPVPPPSARSASRRGEEGEEEEGEENERREHRFEREEGDDD